MHKNLRNTLVAGLVGTALLVPSAQLAAADPVDGADTTTTTTATPSAVTGDGVWAPSHDEALALIPVCSGPLATLDWLVANFTDHGRDIRLAIVTNVTALRQILTFSANPYGLLRLAFQDILQAPVYAVNDTVFHQRATVSDILNYCASTRN